MLWYLANGSLNEYLSSQVQLQGHYYSGQQTELTSAEYASNTGVAQFKQLKLANLQDHHSKYVLIIDNAFVEVLPEQSSLVTQINQVSIDNLTINIERKSGNESNVEQLIKTISLKLAHDYPKHYPAISAKIYAANNPSLNADEYAKKHPQTMPVIKDNKPKKTRGKPQQKIAISAITIKTVTLNTIKLDGIDTVQLHDIKISIPNLNEGYVSNQLGGELLLTFLSLAG